MQSDLESGTHGWASRVNDCSHWFGWNGSPSDDQFLTAGHRNNQTCRFLDDDDGWYWIDNLSDKPRNCECYL